MTYRDQLFALAARWKFGDGAEWVLELLPVERRVPASIDDALPRLTRLGVKESARVRAWGRRRWGTAWDRLDPRVRAQLVKQHGRNH